MKLSRLLSIVTLAALVTACGQQPVRTINIIGLDGMKFAVEEVTDGITVSDTLTASDLQGQNQELRRLETIVAQPGERIKIVLTTWSQLPPVAMGHNWVLLAMDTDANAFARAAIQAKENDYVPQDRLNEVLAQSGMAAGGQTEEVTFTVPETPGEYDYICTFPGHFSAGMRGKLVVQSEEAGA